MIELLWCSKRSTVNISPFFCTFNF